MRPMLLLKVLYFSPKINKLQLLELDGFFKITESDQYVFFPQRKDERSNKVKWYDNGYTASDTGESRVWCPLLIRNFYYILVFLTDSFLNTEIILAYDSKNTKSLSKTSRTINDSLLGDVISSWKSSENAFVCVFIRERERERETGERERSIWGEKRYWWKWEFCVILSILFIYWSL